MFDIDQGLSHLPVLGKGISRAGGCSSKSPDVSQPLLQAPVAVLVKLTNIENCLASGNLMARLQEEKNYMDFGPKMCSWARKRREAWVCRQSNSKRHPRKGQA